MIEDVCGRVDKTTMCRGSDKGGVHVSVLVEFTTGATGSIATVVNDELVRSSFLDYAETPDLIGGAGVEPVEAPLDLSHSRPQPRQHVVEEPDTPSAWDALRDIS